MTKNRPRAKMTKPVNFKIDKEYPPRIPEGEYDAICIGIETGRSWGGDMDIYIKFRIVDINFDGYELFMACSYSKQKMSTRTKYYEQWVLVTARHPSKQDRLNPEIFLNKMYVVKVRDTAPKYSDGTPKPDIFKYSVVDRIIKLQRKIRDEIA